MSLKKFVKQQLEEYEDRGDDDERKFTRIKNLYKSLYS